MTLKPAADAVSRLDRSHEEDAQRWIEEVSEFDAPERGDTVTGGGEGGDAGSDTPRRPAGSAARGA